MRRPPEPPDAGPQEEAPREPAAQAEPRGGVVRNAGLMTVATVVGQLATFALSIALGRALGAETYGVYGLAAAVATVIVPITDLGLTQYVAREVARRGDAARPVVRSVVRAKLVSASVTLLLAGIVTPLAFDDGRLAAAVLLLLGAYLSDGAAQFAYGYFQGRERMGLQAGLTAGTSLARGLGGIAVVLVFDALVPVLVWIAVTAVVQMLAVGWRMRRSVQRLPPGATASIEWRSVAAMGLVTVFAMVYLRADLIMIGAFSGERDAGWYTAAYALTAALQIVPWMASLALAPVFARTFEREPGAFSRAWNGGVRAVLLLVVPMALAVSVLAGPIVDRFYGDGFSPAADALAVLVWASPAWGLNMVLTAGLRGARREGWIAASTGAAAALNVALNLWAIPAFGIVGAAAVTVGTEAVVLVVLLLLTVRRGVLPAPVLPAGGLLAGLGALAAVAVLLRGLPVELALAAAAGAYAGTLWTMGTITAADVGTLLRVVRRR